MTKLQKAAKELNSVLGLDPKIKVVGLKEDALRAKVVEALGLVDEDEDEISQESIDTFIELGIWPFAGEDGDDDEDEDEDDTEDEDEDEDEVDAEVEKIVAIIEKAAGMAPEKGIKLLRKAIAENPQFAGIAKKTTRVFAVGELSTMMLDALGVSQEEIEDDDAPVAVSAKPVKGSKKETTPAPAPVKEKAPKAEKAPKGESGESAYGLTVALMCAAPDQTKDELVKKLKAAGIDVALKASAVNTGYTTIRKIVGLLRANKLMK